MARVAPLTDETEARIRALRAQGYGFVKIAQDLGISRDRLYILVGRIGDPTLAVNPQNTLAVQRAASRQAHGTKTRAPALVPAVPAFALLAVPCAIVPA